MHSLGQLTLTISSTIYLIWFIPQIILNFKRKDTEGLSLLMHAILCFGYLTDLIYGFGLNMQWQYRAVTIAGLCSLAVQHYQFGRYGLHRLNQKLTYHALTLLCSIVFSFAIYVINFGQYSQRFYDHIGIFSNACGLAFMLPQIIKNFNNQSTVGLSPYFVMIAIFLNVCDSISAWTLNWDYPSKVAPFISMMGNIILLSQVFYYEFRNKNFTRLAIDS